MRPLVLYHHPCADGFCAAWVANNYLKDAEFIGVNYGQLPPNVNNRVVYILDFSYKKPVMEQIINDAEYVVVLDHHKTAKADLESLNIKGKAFIEFDLTQSGAMLAWNYFNPGTMVPDIVKYVQDRDLWSWKLDHSKEINAFIASYPKDFEVWDTLYQVLGGLPGDQIRGDSESFGDAVRSGAAIIRYQQQVIAEHIANAVEVTLAGHKVLVTNCTNAGLISEVGEKLSENRAFGVTFFDRLKDFKYVFSLRSRPPNGIDVSAIAKSFGGGGHPQAAGFEIEELPFYYQPETK